MNRETLSFRVVPGPKGIAEAEQRLRDLGLAQIKRSRDGRYLHIVAPRADIEKVFNFTFTERSKQVRTGPVVRTVRQIQAPEKIEISAKLCDVVEGVIFPVSPDYHASPTGLSKASIR